MKRDLVVRWIHKALELDLGDKIYIPIETRERVLKEIKKFNKEFEVLSQIDPQTTGTIVAHYTFKDKTNWLVLERTIGSPLVGFVKKADGSKLKVSISQEKETNNTCQKLQNRPGSANAAGLCKED